MSNHHLDKSDSMKFDKIPIAGIVNDIFDYGIQVLLKDDCIGVIHYQDKHLGNLSRLDLIHLKVGDEIQVQIISSLPELQRISLIPYPNKLSDVQRYAITHREGDLVSGIILSAGNGAILVSLNSRVAGQLRYTSNREAFGKNRTKKLCPGDKVEISIAQIDTRADRIYLCFRGRDGLENKKVTA